MSLSFFLQCCLQMCWLDAVLHMCLAYLRNEKQFYAVLIVLFLLDTLNRRKGDKTCEVWNISKHKTYLKRMRENISWICSVLLYSRNELSHVQACNQLGTPGGWGEEFVEGAQKHALKYSSFKLCSTHFLGAQNICHGDEAPLRSP